MKTGEEELLESRARRPTGRRQRPAPSRVQRAASSAVFSTHLSSREDLPVHQGQLPRRQRYWLGGCCHPLFRVRGGCGIGHIRRSPPLVRPGTRSGLPGRMTGGSAPQPREVDYAIRHQSTRQVSRSVSAVWSGTFTARPHCPRRTACSSREDSSRRCSDTPRTTSCRPRRWAYGSL